jgi:tetratricopeptide (TPR) repeat protein
MARHRDLTRALDDICTALNQCRYRQCIQHCRAALEEYASHRRPADNAQLAALHNFCGLANKRYGRLSLATTHYRKAFALRNCSSYLNNQALVYQERGQFEQAEMLFRKTLAMPDDDAYDTNFHRVNAAGVSIDRGEYQKAAMALKLAFHNYCRLRQSLDPVAMSYLLHRAGRLLSSLGYFREAIHLLSEVLLFRQERYGETHIRTAEAAAVLAQVELDAEMLASAMNHCTLAGHIYRPLVSKTNLRLARLEMMKGNILDQRGKRDVTPYFDRAERILSKVRKNRVHPDWARLLQFQAEHLIRQHKWHEAIERYRQAEEVYETLYGRDNFPYRAELYYNRGHCLFTLGETQGAWRQFVRSRHILTSLNPHHPWLHSVHSYMATVLHKEGRITREKRFRQACTARMSDKKVAVQQVHSHSLKRGIRILLLGTPDMQSRLTDIRLKIENATLALGVEGMPVCPAICLTLADVLRETGRARSQYVMVAGVMGSRRVNSKPSPAVLADAPWAAGYRHRGDTDTMIIGALPYCQRVWLYCLEDTTESVSRRFRRDLTRVSPAPVLSVDSHTATQSLEDAFLHGIRGHVMALQNECVHPAQAPL